MPAGEKYSKIREQAANTIKHLSKTEQLPGEIGSRLQELLKDLDACQHELEAENEELQAVRDVLELENQRYLSLFEYSPVGYLLMDEKGLIFDANQTLWTLLEIPKEKIIGKNVRDFLEKDSQNAFYYHLMDLLERGKSSSCLLNFQHPFKENLWLKMESKTFFSKHHDQFMIQSSLSDVTDAREKEEQLLQLSTAFEQSANSILITDTCGSIQFANPRFYEATGYSPEEVIGKNPRLIKHESSEVDYGHLWKTISSGNTWKGEFQNRSKSGKLFWELATITPVKNKDGVIINYLGIKEDITQRKMWEDNLQKAKDFYLSLMEDFPVMVWQTNEHGEFNFFNKTFTSFTGRSKKFTQNNHYTDLIFEMDRTVFLDSFDYNRKSRTPFVVEYRLRDRFGNYRWVLNHARPFINMDGQYGGYIATCTDIHDRKVVEERLTESDNRYRRMFEDSSLGIFKLDRNFRFVNANKAFAEMFGYENTFDFLVDINNKPELFFPDLEQERNFRIQLVKSKENRFSVEKEFTRIDNTPLFTIIHLRKVYERNHQKQYYMEGFIEDITNRMLAEKQLLVSEHKFKALFEKSYDAILILDNEQIVECNTKASLLFNMSFGELTQRSYFELSPPFQPGNTNSTIVIRERLAAALEGENQHFEWMHMRQKTVFDAEVSFARIFMNDKFMVQVIVRDVSEKKLAEMQLKQAKEEAEKARMAQSEFLSLMSHEIRTPLNAVVSLTDLMLHEDQNPEQKENLESVKISARHLLGLIDDILDFNKIDSGNIQFENEEFDIRHLVDHINKALEIKAQEKNIQLITKVEKNVPAVLIADTLRLKQILFNMVSNAIKFTETGYVSLTVKTLDNHNNHIWFVVKDTGIGISESRLGAIFDKFTQEHTSTTRKYGGSGLGLTICKKLVELQDGNIFASSTKGVGSEFSFFIPMETGSKTPQSMALTKTARDLQSLEGMNILLVEDDKMNQFVARKVIGKKWETNLVIVDSGEDALNELSSKEFDLVLMDLLLPNMDGYQVSQKIRSNDNGLIKNPSIPIIALTADAFVETRNRALEAGMNDFVSKPFDYENLYKKIAFFKSGVPSEKKQQIN
jgi:two-component system, sensor histidine kinase